MLRPLRPARWRLCDPRPLLFHLEEALENLVVGQVGRPAMGGGLVVQVPMHAISTNGSLSPMYARRLRSRTAASILAGH